MRFTLSHRIQGICGETRGIAKLRMDGGTGGAKAHREIPLAVHGYTAHPAPGCVGLISALLVDRDRPSGNVAKLEPTHRCDTAGAHRVVTDNRFVAAEIPIGQAKHEAIADAIEVVRRRNS